MNLSFGAKGAKVGDMEMDFLVICFFFILLFLIFSNFGLSWRQGFAVLSLYDN
jgi:hypothetical protein